MKYLILGAGPAGLTFANMLLQSGEKDFLVIEKEGQAGGLCRSAEADGHPIDIGGGHFLDVRRPKANEFLFRFMPESEWLIFDRKTTIQINGNTIGQPIEAHIWQMKLDDQVNYIKSIAAAGCNMGKPIPEKFIDWIFWKLGERIASDYMIPYNQKMFGSNLDLLGTYWLEKLPNVSFDETLLSCLTKKAYGSDPGHTKFYYPKKYGYGELWLRMAKKLEDRIVYNSHITSLDFNSRKVTLEDGRSFQAEMIITTIPWVEYTELIGMPDSLKQSIRELKHSSIQIDYYPDNKNTDSQWIYYPDPSLSYHRILVRHNFCLGSKGYWTETNSERIFMNDKKSMFSYFNSYAYPLNTIQKPQIMNDVLKWCESRGVFGLGRWGEHQHYNSDVTVELAMKKACELT